MRARLDPASPVPLYHQLAEAIRYQIATGALARGDRLPSLRDAADQWGVNLHTVRHAYASLATQGLVETRGTQGTTVLGASANGRVRPDAARFIARVRREASVRYGLSPPELARLLARGDESDAGDASGPVFVVECSDSQAEDLAQQLAARWHIDAQPWSLERPGEPPVGEVVATYFHYNDLRTAWPERFSRVHFVSIRPDPTLVDRVEAISPRRRPAEVVLCERDPEMARNIAADLAAVLPADRFRLKSVISDVPSRVLATERGTHPILFAPRMWGQLSARERAHPRALEVRYTFADDDLLNLGSVVGRARSR